MTSNNTPLPPGRELDALIAEKMGWKYEPRFEGDTTGYWNTGKERLIFEEMLAFSLFMDDAWIVVEFMRSKGYRFYLYENDRKYPGDGFVGWVAGFTSRDEMKVNSQWQGDTPAHAICMAFLAIPELV